MPSSVQNRDIVVMGASAGGVKALLELVSRLPPELPAAVFIALHAHPRHQSDLPQLLSSRGSLPASLALHGEEIASGHIYVAPPDNHLTLRRGSLEVLRGPKENGHRPAVDALFRTASRSYGSRVIGVLLTGSLDCGTAGLLSIKGRGGVAIVQDPRDAEVPEMPESAIRHVAIDHVAPLRNIPELIARAVAEPANGGAASHQLSPLEGEAPGTPARVVCPACQGDLTEATVDGFTVLRCHVGHSFSLQGMDEEQANEIERALWAAARALEEGATLSRRLASTSIGDLRERFTEKAYAQSKNAALLRDWILKSPR